MSITFTVTPSATNRIKDILKMQDQSPKTHFFRLSVEGGGCSGFQYKMDIDTHLAEDDIIIDHNGIRTVIDAVSAPYVNNATLDFESSLGGSVLKVINPNATSSCGCGTSFDI